MLKRDPDDADADADADAEDDNRTPPPGILGLQRAGRDLSGDSDGVMKALAAVRKLVDTARRIVILTGAGISAESGIPTFRGAGGLWRTFAAQELATPQAFKSDPSLVWEFYHYRRQVVHACHPNEGHFAVAALQRRLAAEGREVAVITQNIDRLHQAAGATDVLELHGSLWLLKRVGEPGFLEEPGRVWEDRRVPLAPCFEGRCQPHPTIKASDIPVAELPRAEDDGAMLRPAVVWFNEGLDPRVLDRAHALLEACDLMLVVGTSSVVYPAAGFVPLVAGQGKPVVEVNLEATDNSGICDIAIQGKAGETLPALFGVAGSPELATVKREHQEQQQQQKKKKKK